MCREQTRGCAWIRVAAQIFGSKEFTALEGLAMFLCCIAVQLGSEWITQWGTYFYSPLKGAGRVVFVAIGLAATIFVIGYCVSAVSDPLVGLWSDKTRTQPGRGRLLPISGRRRPFMFWGSIALTFTGILFWFPPVAGQSNLNFAYGTGILCLHWFIFSTCSVPFTSLSPEIARSQDARVKIGTWIAAGMIVGLAIAEIAPGKLVRMLDTAPPLPQAVAAAAELSQSGDEEPPTSPVGFQRTAILFSILSLVFFQFCVWTVRERYQSSESQTYTPPLRVIAQTLKNAVFLKYVVMFFLFNLGYLAVQRALPYWAVAALRGNEETVSKLMLPYIGFALGSLAFTGPLSKYVPIKWLIFISLGILTSGLPMMYFISVADIGPAAKFWLAAALFSYCGIGQGMQYMLLTPLIGEIIDLDEQQSGERREAIYQSVSGLAWKASQALSVYVMAFSLHTWGDSVEHPLGIYLVGPIAGLFGLLGMAVCWTYPVLHVTKEAPPPMPEGQVPR